MDKRLPLLFLALLLAASAQGATSAPRHDNSLGVVIPYDNPYVYNVGSISSGTVVRDKAEKLATSIQFQPFRTFELYTEQLLFCGNRAEDFRGAVGPIVLTYKRVAHEMVGGVACHELDSVLKISVDKDEQ